MKHLKFYENFGIDYSFFDEQMFYGKLIYRGIYKSEYDNYKNNGNFGNFFTEDYRFSEDYGDYILEAKLETDKIFNSHDPRNIRKLYDDGYKLTDIYIKDSNNRDKYPTYDFDNNVFQTYGDYQNSPHMDDTWDIIENSNVIDYILNDYDAILISEGGINNYYIENKDVLDVVKITNV